MRTIRRHSMACLPSLRFFFLLIFLTGILIGTEGALVAQRQLHVVGGSVTTLEPSSLQLSSRAVVRGPATMLRSTAGNPLVSPRRVTFFNVLASYLDIGIRTTKTVFALTEADWALS